MMGGILDPTSLLQTSARFIAENDQYVVLAIRLEKKMLHENARTLLAAIDIAADQALLPDLKICRTP